MGVWALEFNAGLTGVPYEMVNFNGDVFAFQGSGTGSGVWQRTPPGPPLWTRTMNFAGGGVAAVWDGKMFAGGTAIPWLLYRSEDGVTWSQDLDIRDWCLGVCGYSWWSALGGYGDYLYAAQYCDMADGLGWAKHIWRRDKQGNWIEYPPAYTTVGHCLDVIGYGGNVYLSTGTRVHYYDGAWHNEPTLDWESSIYFTERNGILYAYGDQVHSWRRTLTSSWTQELNVGAPWGASGAVSIGDDGQLWAAADDGANSRVYVRSGGHWVLHSTIAATMFGAACAHEGAAYAGINPCQFWAYTPDFAVAPGGLPPQAMDVDGDGDALYVGLYNAAAQPVLVKVAAPLVNTAVGNAVFNPLAGTSINVRCGGVGGELAISGSFAAAPGNEQVEVSEDGGGTWTDIDRDAWGVEVAQPLLVDPDDAANCVMVALATAQDIVETTDGGATAWVVNNAAVGYSPGAMAKLPEGDELVIGDDAANRIDYSPNRGVTLQNITGAFGGNPTALEVA